MWGQSPPRGPGLHRGGAEGAEKTVGRGGSPRRRIRGQSPPRAPAARGARKRWRCRSGGLSPKSRSFAGLARRSLGGGVSSGGSAVVPPVLRRKVWARNLRRRSAGATAIAEVYPRQRMPRKIWGQRITKPRFRLGARARRARACSSRGELVAGSPVLRVERPGPWKIIAKKKTTSSWWALQDLNL